LWFKTPSIFQTVFIEGCTVEWSVNNESKRIYKEEVVLV
jgi:hypothetical protein